MRKKFALFMLFASARVFGADIPDIQSRAAALLDAETGVLLFEKNKNAAIPPASLTKLMTIHLALSEVDAGKAELDEQVNLPRASWAISQPPRSSLMWLAEGQRVTLRELLLGLAVSSGNDAAVAVALRFAPSVGDFARLMNEEAESLGLETTNFVEPSGVSEYNITTAWDFARFCRFYVQRHPESLSMFHSVPSFAYPKPENMPESYRGRPQAIEQKNRNNLLGEGGVDGLKTGYIDESGYNIALTGKRGETRLIAVILGADDDKTRDADGGKLLEWGFSNYRTLHPVQPDIPLQRVWKSKQKYAPLELGGDLVFTAKSRRGEGMRFEFEINKPLIAPLAKGGTVGNAILYDSLGELRRIPLLISQDIERGGFFTRLWDSILLFFQIFFIK
jgi:D-alanyl-D-alanine carboxypeptidase (penicillin-binding protein 5/6)